MAYLRHVLTRVPANVGGLGMERMEGFEREQARLTGGPVAPVVADPAHDAETARIEARRLWATIPGVLPWTDQGASVE